MTSDQNGSDDLWTKHLIALYEAEDYVQFLEDYCHEGLQFEVWASIFAGKELFSFVPNDARPTGDMLYTAASDLRRRLAADDATEPGLGSGLEFEVKAFVCSKEVRSPVSGGTRPTREQFHAASQRAAKHLAECLIDGLRSGDMLGC